MENYRKLHEAGIGTYILFQETYDKDAYEKLHPYGPKHDYAYHTEAMDRAMEGGIDDVGLGVLFGLDKYRYEFAGLLMHAEHLEAVHGVGPHTISVPRVKKADDIDPDAFDNGISDDIFCKIAACIRIAVPYTGMIISTRENPKVRDEIIRLGVSQISGGSKPSVGYREGRTGDRFMSLCKSGQIQNCCHPNALMTLEEYLVDYASPETAELGRRLIQDELKNIPNEKVRQIVVERLDRIKHGDRDFRF